MPSTDLTMPAELMIRLRRIEPDGIGIGKITGTNQHLVRAELRRMERRGEVRGHYGAARVDPRTGTIEIPYVRLRTRAQIRARRAAWVAGSALAGVSVVFGLGWLAWESRYVIGAVLGAAALLIVASWLAPHWTRGCPGLHCAGCRG